MLPGHHTIQLPQLEMSHFLLNLWGKIFSQRYICWLISPVRRDETVLMYWAVIGPSWIIRPRSGWPLALHGQKETICIRWLSSLLSPLSVFRAAINHQPSTQRLTSFTCTAYSLHLVNWAAHCELPSWERNPDKHVVQIISRWLQTTV